MMKLAVFAAVATVALAVPQIQFKHAIDETPCVIQMDKNNQLHSDCPIFASNVATTGALSALDKKTTKALDGLDRQGSTAVANLDKKTQAAIAAVEAKLPCEAGETKENGMIGDKCVSCADGYYKPNIGYEECVEHDWICGPGEFYAEYSKTEIGYCKPCPTGTWKDGWSSAGVTCANHDLKCAKGEYLEGASSSAPGTCVTCPVNTYNENDANRDGKCNFHGDCPPGTQPSTLSKTEQSYCEPCAPGTFSASLSSLEMCQPNTQCSAGQALIGASVTAAGTCYDKCHDHITNANNVGSGRDIGYLNRHNLDCPKHEVLGGMGMSDFQLHRSASQKVEYKYRCCDLEVDPGTQFKNFTTAAYHGVGSQGHRFLERHTLDCGPDYVIKAFSLYRAGKQKVAYHYDCIEHPTPAGQCTDYYTPTAPIGNSLFYLENHHVDCPETSQPYLQFMRLFRPSASTLSYHYKCCA